MEDIQHKKSLKPGFSSKTRVLSAQLAQKVQKPSISIQILSFCTFCAICALKTRVFHENPGFDDFLCNCVNLTVDIQHKKSSKPGFSSKPRTNSTFILQTQYFNSNTQFLKFLEDIQHKKCEVIKTRVFVENPGFEQNPVCPCAYICFA